MMFLICLGWLVLFGAAMWFSFASFVLMRCALAGWTSWFTPALYFTGAIICWTLAVEYAPFALSWRI